MGALQSRGADATAPCASRCGSMQLGMRDPNGGFPWDTLLLLTQPWSGKSAPHPTAGKGGPTAGSRGTGTSRGMSDRLARDREGLGGLGGGTWGWDCPREVVGSW